MERLIDRAADEMGINRLTLRKRNFIKPNQMPFPASSGVTYDSGDFQAVFSKALELADYENFAKRKRESKKAGKLRGIAVGSYLEVTAPPSGELGKITFEPDGTVKLTTGTLEGTVVKIGGGNVRTLNTYTRFDLDNFVWQTGFLNNLYSNAPINYGASMIVPESVKVGDTWLANDGNSDGGVDRTRHSTGPRLF